MMHPTPPTSPFEPGNVRFRAFLSLSGKRYFSFCFLLLLLLLLLFFFLFWLSLRDKDQQDSRTHTHTRWTLGGALGLRPSFAALFSHGLVFLFTPFLCYAASTAAILADFSRF